VEGVRLLKLKNLALMTANRLTDTQRATATNLGMPVFGTGNSFGLGVATVIDPAKAMRSAGAAASA
jgi:hypothetical protein